MHVRVVHVVEVANIYYLAAKKLIQQRGCGIGCGFRVLILPHSITEPIVHHYRLVVEEVVAAFIESIVEPIPVSLQITRVVEGIRRPLLQQHSARNHSSVNVGNIPEIVCADIGMIHPDRGSHALERV